jgi:serine-type D-Ala-D-Ala carboxypeptidase (penicillin-binding protein 5/6)
MNPRSPMKSMKLALLAPPWPRAPGRAQTPQPPEIAARQYLLIDLGSNQVLAERDADAQADPASLTKLMTAYLVFNALRDEEADAEQTLPVSRSAPGPSARAAAR